MNRLYPYRTLFDPNPAPGGGGGATAEAAAPSAPGAPAPTPGPGPAPTASPAPPAPADPQAAANAARQAAYDRMGWNDAQRAQADQILNQYEALDPAARALAIADLAAQGRGERPPASERPAPEAPAEPQDPRDKAIHELQTGMKQILDRFKGEDQQRQTGAQQAAWRDEVKAALGGAPGLSDLITDEADLVAAADEALGYCGTNIKKHGGSKQAALKAWIELQTARAARAAGKGVKEFVEGKLAARAAQTETGGGRPPAETNKAYTAEDLESGKIGQDLLTELKGK